MSLMTLDNQQCSLNYDIIKSGYNCDVTLGVQFIYTTVHC
jgi:hypothetical protein